MQTKGNATINHAGAVQLSLAAGAKLRDLARQVHPAWLMRLNAPFGVAGKGVFSADLFSQALLEQFALRWPDLSALTHPLQCLWLLPRKEIARVCQSKTLFDHRSQLIRSVDAQLRRDLRTLVGDAVFEKILQIPFRPEETSDAVQVSDPKMLALEGLSRLCTQYPSADGRHWTLAAMALPCGDSEPACENGRLRGNGKSDKSEFAGLLLEFFPEHAWLFGLKLDSKLSA